MTSLETGDTSSGDVACFILYMPRVDWFKQNVAGQLSDMTEAENWTELGTVTREQAAIIAADMVRRLIIVNFDPLPAGRVEAYAGTTIPDGWLLCDGSSLNVTDFPELFAAIAYTWGGSGSTFNLPDLQNRVIVGAGDDFALADTGGEETHTLVTGEIPAHSHVATGTSVVDLGHTHV